MKTCALTRVSLLAFILFLAALFLASLSNSGTLVQRGRLYFVDVGPAGPDLATVQAIDVIKQVDVIFAPNFIQKDFSEYLKGKDVRIAWPDSVYMVGHKSYVEVESADERKSLGQAITEHADDLARQFKKEMAQNKSVALLVNGDPSLFSDLRWFKRHFRNEEFEIIPGLSSFNVGAALFKADLAQRLNVNTIIISSQIGQPVVGQSPLQKLGKFPATIVFFMVGDLGKLVNDLRKEYDSDTPIAVAYFVGYPEKQKLIKGTLSTILRDTASETEKEMRLIYVGEFMK